MVYFYLLKVERQFYKWKKGKKTDSKIYAISGRGIVNNEMYLKSDSFLWWKWIPWL